METQTADFDIRLKRINRTYAAEWKRQNGHTLGALFFGAVGRQFGFVLLLALAYFGTKVALALAVGSPAFDTRLAEMAQGDVVERTLSVVLTPDPASEAVSEVITYLSNMELSPQPAQ